MLHLRHVAVVAAGVVFSSPSAGNWTVNATLQKGFALRDGVRLDVRLDAFNAFNRVNYNNPNTNITSPDFGRLLSAPGARTAQIGARLGF